MREEEHRMECIRAGFDSLLSVWQELKHHYPSITGLFGECEADREECLTLTWDDSVSITVCWDDDKGRPYYMVSEIAYYPGGREQPPEMDIINEESHLTPISAVRDALERVSKSFVEGAFNKRDEWLLSREQIKEAEAGKRFDLSKGTRIRKPSGQIVRRSGPEREDTSRLTLEWAFGPQRLDFYFDPHERGMQVPIASGGFVYSGALAAYTQDGGVMPCSDEVGWIFAGITMQECDGREMRFPGEFTVPLIQRGTVLLPFPHPLEQRNLGAVVYGFTDTQVACKGYVRNHLPVGILVALGPGEDWPQGGALGWVSFDVTTVRGLEGA